MNKLFTIGFGIACLGIGGVIGNQAGYRDATNNHTAVREAFSTMKCVSRNPLMDGGEVIEPVTFASSVKVDYARLIFSNLNCEISLPRQH